MQKYEKVDILGEGGYAKIFKVRRKSDGELFVIKTYIGDNPDVNEIDILTRFKHPNLLHCVDCFFDEADKELYIVLPLAEFDLEEYIGRKYAGGLSVGKCKSVLFQLASAVHFMHSNNIYHCDIKPANILLHKNEIMVADFGLSFPNTMQGKGMRCGTLGYASPQASAELAKNMDEFRPTHEDDIYKTLRSYTQQKGNEYYRGDVFAIGMVLLYCLTGEELVYSLESAWEKYAHAEEMVERALQANRDSRLLRATRIVGFGNKSTIPFESEDFDKLAQICKEACRLSHDARTTSVKQILGNQIFGGDQPIQGSLDKVTLGAIPSSVAGKNLSQICKILFGWLSEVCVRLTNPIIVLNLAIEIFIRAASLPKDAKELQLYGCAALFCADYTINSNASQGYNDYKKVSNDSFTNDQMKEAVKKLIGYLHGRMTSEIFAFRHTDAYLSLYYLYGVTLDATKYLLIDPEGVEDEYKHSKAYRKKPLEFGDVETFKFDLSKNQLIIDKQDGNSETLDMSAD